MATVQTEMTAIQTKGTAVLTEMTAGLTEMTYNQAELITSHEFITSQTELTAIQAERIAVQTESTAIQTEGTAFPTEMTANQTAVTDLQTELTANQTEVTTNQTEATAVKTGVTACQTERTANQSEVTANQTELAANPKPVDRFENILSGLLVPVPGCRTDRDVLIANPDSDGCETASSGSDSEAEVSLLTLKPKPDVVDEESDTQICPDMDPNREADEPDKDSLEIEIPQAEPGTGTISPDSLIAIESEPDIKTEDLVSLTSFDLKLDFAGFEPDMNSLELEVKMDIIAPNPDNHAAVPDAPILRLDKETVELETSQTQLNIEAGEPVNLRTYEPKLDDNEPMPKTRFDKLLSELLEPNVDLDIQAEETSHLIAMKSEPDTQTVHRESKEFESTQADRNIDAEDTVSEIIDQERYIDDVWPDPEITTPTEDMSAVKTPEAETDIGTEEPDSLISFEQEPVKLVVEPDTQLVDPNCKASVGSMAMDTHAISEVKDSSTIETFASDMTTQIFQAIPSSVPDLETTPPEPDNRKPEPETTFSEPDTVNPDSDTLLTCVEAVDVKPTRELLIRPTKPQRNAF